MAIWPVLVRHLLLPLLQAAKVVPAHMNRPRLLGVVPPLREHGSRLVVGSAEDVEPLEALHGE